MIKKKKTGLSVVRKPANMRNPERTRQQLLKFARQQFAEKGLAGARVDEIARKAGVNKQALYYHFGSKEDLFREALADGYRRFRERDRDIVVDAKPPTEALADLISVTFDDLHHSPELIAIIGEENRQRGRHLDKGRVRAINKPLVESLQRILHRGQQEGVFRAGVDVEDLYISVMSLVMFGFSNVYTLSAVLDRDLTKEAAVRQRRSHIVDWVLRSLRRP